MWLAITDSGFVTPWKWGVASCFHDSLPVALWNLGGKDRSDRSCHFWVLLVSQSPVTPMEESNHEQWKWLWSFFLIIHSQSFQCTVAQNSLRYQCLCATWCLPSSVIRSLKLTAACRHFYSNNANTSNPNRPSLSLCRDKVRKCCRCSMGKLRDLCRTALCFHMDSGGLRWTVDRIHKEPQRTYPQLTGTLTVSHHLSPIFPTLRCVIAVCAGYGLAVAPFSYLSLCKTRTESGDTFNAHGWNRLVPLAASFCQLPFYYVGFESAWCDPGAVAVSLALRLSFLFAKHTSAQILSLARGQVSIVSQVVEGRQTGLCCVNLLKLWQG